MNNETDDKEKPQAKLYYFSDFLIRKDEVKKVDLATRIEAIKVSTERINKLMEEMRKP